MNELENNGFEDENYDPDYEDAGLDPDEKREYREFMAEEERRDGLQQMKRDEDGPQEEDFDSWEEYQEARINWQVDQRVTKNQAPAQAPQVDPGSAAAADRQGLLDLSDPRGSERAEIKHRIVDYLNSAAHAQARGDAKAQLEWEKRAEAEQRAYNGLPPSPSEVAAEQENLEVLESFIENAMDASSLWEIKQRVGSEKLLDDTRTCIDSFNRISQGSYLYVIEGDSKYGQPPEVTPDAILKIDLESKDAADRARRFATQGHNLWDYLKAQHYVGATPKETPKKSEPVPDRDPSKMSAAEYRDWRLGKNEAEKTKMIRLEEVLVHR